MSDCLQHNRAPSLTPTAAAIWGRRQTFRASLSRIAVKDDGIDLKRKPKPKPVQAETAPPPNVQSDVSDGDFITNLVIDLDLLLHPPHLPNADIRYSIQEIQSAFCRAAGVSRVDMLSPRRTEPLVRYRQLTMAVCKELTLRSLPEIGRRFGGRDHTTVLHSTRKMQPVMADIADILDEAPLYYIALVAISRANAILLPSKRKPSNRYARPV